MKDKKFGNLKGIDMGASLNILIIQDNLTTLKSTNFLRVCIANYLLNHSIVEVIEEIVSMHEDNPTAVISTIGQETWDLIKEYKGL